MKVQTVTPYRVSHLQRYGVTVRGNVTSVYTPLDSVVYRGGGGVKLPPPKFLSFDKAEPNSQFRGKHIRNNLISIRVSLICKFSGTPD
jgi:hypothetical protein